MSGGGRPNLILAPGPGLWSLNRTEQTEFVLTKNGPVLDLDLSMIISSSLIFDLLGIGLNKKIN